jgi:hypothetical protein
MPLPPELMIASKLSRPNGRTPDAASAPNMQAEITLLFLVATLSISKATTRFAATAVASMTTFGSTMASPGFSFSATAYKRCVEAINVVRSGVARPRKMDRAASISSVASTISTSP